MSSKFLISVYPHSDHFVNAQDEDIRDRLETNVGKSAAHITNGPLTKDRG